MIIVRHHLSSSFIIIRSHLSSQVRFRVEPALALSQDSVLALHNALDFALSKVVAARWAQEACQILVAPDEV